MQDSKSAEPEEAGKPGRWAGMVESVRRVGKQLRADADGHQDPHAKLLEESGVLSRRYSETFLADGKKVNRVYAWYDHELKNGVYTIRIKPSLTPHLDLIALGKDLGGELYFLMRNHNLWDNTFMHISWKPHFVAGYLELKVTCAKDGWYLKTVALMNDFLEDCIKKHEVLRK